MGKRSLVFGLGLALALLASDRAWATAPTSFSVQGVLRDGAGALQSTTADVTVTLSGMSSAYSQTVTGVGVSNGLFTASFPSPTLASLESATSVSMTVSVKVPSMTGTTTTFAAQTVNSQLFAMEAAVADSYNGVLPIANGGTGSSTQNFVDLSSNQTVGGQKVFSANILFSPTAPSGNPLSSANWKIDLSSQGRYGLGYDPAAEGTVGDMWFMTQGGYQWWSLQTDNILLGITDTGKLAFNTAGGPVTNGASWKLDLLGTGQFGIGADPGATDNGHLWYESRGGHEWYTYNAGTPKGIMYVGPDGQVHALLAYVTTGVPDLAETISAPADVRAADVVCADPNRSERVVRCDNENRTVVGVISDGSSSFLINSHAKGLHAKLNGAPLVLAGRVPVKVSTQNGPIAIGDYLAPSSIPGVAVKAIKPGRTVGIALASFDGKKGKTGTVLTLIKVGEQGAAAEVAQLSQRLDQLRADNDRLRGDNARMQKQLAELATKVDAILAQAPRRHGSRLATR